MTLCTSLVTPLPWLREQPSSAGAQTRTHTHASSHPQVYKDATSRLVEFKDRLEQFAQVPPRCLCVGACALVREDLSEGSLRRVLA